MARIDNIFTGDTAQPVTGFGLWSFSGATTRIETESTPINVESMIHVIPISNNAVTISLTNFPVPSARRGSSVDFGFYIRCDSRIDVTIEATSSSLESTLLEPDAFLSQTQTFIPVRGEWVFPRVSRISTGTNQTAQFLNIVLTIVGHEQTPIYFARPILVPTLFHREDFPSLVVQSNMPPDIMDIDETSMPLVAGVGRLLHILSIAYEDVYEELFSIMNLDHIDSYNERTTEFSSSLVNPELVNVEKARWLAQFLGALLIDSSSGLTPWANLPKTWTQWIAQIDTADAGTTVEWQEIESFDIELIGLEEYFRWQLVTGAYSQNAGTLNAIKQAAQNVLSGTKTVDIYSNTANPYTIYVRTLTAETDEVTLAAALYAAKPVGFAYNIANA
jgi:hypothetical protein